MLTIPESIKNLYKMDGTRKNFRVQFPNGELQDITNENIVRESVHFTESICSQSTFRFGLAEASVIEFETVGIGNMYGMTISCSYEIDTSSLSASEIASIQSDPGDGELVLASSSDIGYGFYRVPLGVFRVEKCPRNHGAMTHRQVTGYSASFTSLSPLEITKEARGASVNAYTFDIKAFIYGNIGYWSPETLSGKYIESAVTTSSYSSSITLRATGSVSTYFKIDTTSRRALMPSSEVNLYRFATGGMDYDEAIAWMTEAASSRGLTFRNLNTAFMATYEYPIKATTQTLQYESIGFQKDVPAFYPYIHIEQMPGFTDNPRVTIPNEVTITLYVNGTAVDTYTQTSPETPLVYLLTPATTYTPTMVSVQSTGTRRSVFEGQYVDYFTFTGAIELSDFVNGYYETTGMFGKADRFGGLEDLALSPSSPLAISPGDYDEVWWDEYDVSPIGTVTVTYRNGEEGEATANVTLGAGASLYDMTDNEVLKNLSSADLDSITELLSGDFATNAENVGFTPIEMTMQGWPWLEAGDALQITAEDGTVVNTYALRVEMSGIQHLMSDITAEGGEIIGEV